MSELTATSSSKTPILESFLNPSQEKSTETFGDWKQTLTKSKLHPQRAYDPEMQWITQGELTSIRQQLEYDIVGINETLTELGFAVHGLRDEVYPVDTAGKTRGEYTVVFQFIPNSDAHPLVDGGAYSLALYTAGLKPEEGMYLQFGEIFIAAEGSQVRARREAKRLQTEIITLIEKHLTGEIHIQSHEELFQMIMKKIQSSGDNFMVLNNNNPVGFR